MARRPTEPTPATENMVQTAFRLPAELVARLDRHIERMERAVPGMRFNRADAVRTLLTIALDSAEAADTKQ